MEFKYIEFEFIVRDIIGGFIVLRTEDLNKAEQFIEKQEEPMLYEIRKIKKRR